MIIIFKEKNKEGKFTFTQKELEDLLKKARDEGYEEGRALRHLWYSFPTTAPTITSPNWISTTGTAEKPTEFTEVKI